jgi:oligopeptide/dipeptide ABC transporter ATP-binding protein
MPEERIQHLREGVAGSYLMISHDLGVVEHVSHRVAVMYLGRIVEIAPAKLIFAQPVHPYTELLLGPAPSFDPRNRRGFVVRNDDVASAMNKPGGCAFHRAVRWRPPCVGGRIRR